MVKAVIFDLDDTLQRTSEVRYEALQKAGKKFYNIEITEETIRLHWGKPMQEFISNVFGDVDSIERLMKNYFSLTNTMRIPPYEDALEALPELFDKYLVGVVTAASKSFVMRDMPRASFSVEKFFYIQTEDDTKVHKPDPKVFDPILRKLRAKKIRKEHIVYVGDSLSDYYAARDAGLRFVGIAGRTTPKEHFIKEGATVIERLPELLQLFVNG